MSHAGPAPPRLFHAAPGRPALRIPSLLLLAVLGGCAVAGTAALMRPSLRIAAPDCWRLAAFSAMAYAYLRWVYVPRTSLRLDDTGVTLRQPFSRRELAWRDLAAVAVTTWLHPTHRGGTAAGIRLVSTDNRRLFIPDVFDLPRTPLADLIRHHAGLVRN